MIYKLLISVVILLSTQGYQDLYAQQANKDLMPVRDTTQLKDVELSEVVVTASKSNLKQKEMPAAVSIIPLNSIKANEVTSLTQIGALAPNFVMPSYGSKLTSPVYIRGIGSRINNPSIGLYVDNVPYFEKSAFEFDFFDLERIEILRGPQGTLYGRNSMGGLINIVTRSPLTYQGSQIFISAGNYGNYKMSAAHYAKPSDKFAVSLAANYVHQDGFYTNAYLGKKVDRLNSYGLRNKLIYSPSDKLSVENIASLEQSKQGGYPYGVYVDSIQKTKDVNYNQESSYDRLMFSDAILLKYKADTWDFSNTLSYQYIDDAQKIDQDFKPVSMHFVEQLQTQHMFADEMMFRSNNEKKYSWLFGAFGFRQLSESSVDVETYTSDMWYLKNYDSHVTGLALFHQSTYKLGNFTITGGVRFDYEKSGLKYNYQGTRGTTQLPAIDTTYPDLQDHILLPKIALSYKPGKNTSLYISYTSGYKPGGYNSTFERPDQLTFRNENSFNYELGSKASIFKNWIYADFALFFTRLKNQQIYRTVPSGRGSYLDNAGVSENKGFELSLKNNPISGFEVMLAYGYTESKIIKYIKDETVNYNGKITPYIPRHTLAVQLTQTFTFKTSAFLDMLRMNVLYNQNGKSYWDLSNKYKQKTYGTVNAKISFIKGNLQLEVWGKNLFNANYNTFLFEALGDIYAQTSRPMQLGLNLLYRF